MFDFFGKKTKNKKRTGPDDSSIDVRRRNRFPSNRIGNEMKKKTKKTNSFNGRTTTRTKQKRKYSSPSQYCAENLQRKIETQKKKQTKKPIFLEKKKRNQTRSPFPFVSFDDDEKKTKKKQKKNQNKTRRVESTAVKGECEEERERKIKKEREKENEKERERERLP